MKQLARPPVKIYDVIRGALNELRGDNQIRRRNDHSTLRDQQSPALNTVVDTNVTAPSVFGEPYMGHEVFRHTDAIEQFPLCHSAFPLPTANDYQNTSAGNCVEDSWNDSRNQFCDAWRHFYSKAANGRGVPLAASDHRDEGHRRNHNNPNTAKTIASTIPTAIATIIASLSDIGNSFGYVPQSIRSTQRGCHAVGSIHSDNVRARLLHARRTRLPLHRYPACRAVYEFLGLIASPKAFANNVSILHSLPRANAGHRGCVVGQ